MTLDIARTIGTPLPRNTKANGREMAKGDFLFTMNVYDGGRGKPSFHGDLEDMPDCNVDGDKKWDELFADPRSPALLERLAAEAKIALEPSNVSVPYEVSKDNMSEYEYTPNYADSGDYTYVPRTATRPVAPICSDSEPLTYTALVATVYRLQNELHGLAAQVVEMREQMQKWTADS